MRIDITPEYLASQGLSPTFEDRFWSKVLIVPYDRGCWLWIGSYGHHGYGQIGRWKEKDPPIGAHRASWIINRGPIPEGAEVCHGCDNPPCVNPCHLFIGTHLDNMNDRDRKGRLVVGARHHHEDHHNAKLNWDKVSKMRMLRTLGWSYQDIADEFGVSQSLARQVGARLIWVR